MEDLDINIGHNSHHRAVPPPTTRFPDRACPTTARFIPSTARPIPTLARFIPSAWTERDHVTRTGAERGDGGVGRGRLTS